ncbi:MAG: hypothetical protein IJ527_08375 [Prevotella sp.]|nr:hypothetical protein [Prevotella sp.]
MQTSCSSDIDIPSLPEPESTTIAQGVTLSADQLFGIWEGVSEVGTDNTNHFEQSYRVEFQSVNDAEAVFSHWFVDATSTMRDSICNLTYSYEFDGSTIDLTPHAAATAAGAVKIKGVHTGNNTMVLYAVKNDAVTTMCTLTRTGDPQPSITGVDRTLPQAGETVTLTGRNLQFVDHLYLPTPTGETEVNDFNATSRQIQFTVPSVELTSGYVRCQATGAHVNAYSPAMFCQNCVFFHDFSTHGTQSPYTDTEFENSINITQSLFDKVSVVAADNLPDGHALTEAPGIINPEYMLCFFGETPTPWGIDNNLDPNTGMIRFSMGDRMQYVIDHSDGLITTRSKCKEVAIEMDIYVYSDGQPLWNTGFMSFRLDKDQGKSLTQSWFAQTAMWDLNATVSFANGWQTYTIPLSAFRITESETYATVGSLMNYLKQNNKQAIIKLINYQLDDTHPAQMLSNFQFCIANMRLVPYGIPATTKE